MSLIRGYSWSAACQGLHTSYSSCSSNEGSDSSLRCSSFNRGRRPRLDAGVFTFRRTVAVYDARTSKRRIRRLLSVPNADANYPVKMNLNEYMVTLKKPLGVQIALSVDGTVFIYALKRGGNAEKTRIIMVGDKLMKASNLPDRGFIDIHDLGDAQALLKGVNGSLRLVLERPVISFPIHELLLAGVGQISFNRGRVPMCTWSKKFLVSFMQPCSESSGNTGFAMFSPRFLALQGWKCLMEEIASASPHAWTRVDTLPKHISPVVGIFSEEESCDAEWGYGNFPLEVYIKALERSTGELYYNHSLGMQYSKITEQIYVGSCIQKEEDVHILSNLGISAVLNFQSENERVNWGINSELISQACQKYNVLMVNYPVRDVNFVDLRKRLPSMVGLLLRMLRRNIKVFVTCTTGFDRSPSCIISYLHWIQDMTLHVAHNYVAGLHSCRPDRPAIVWATWDLIAMVENGNHGGPPTHCVTFAWNNGCKEGEDVYLIGDFTANWTESIKTIHKGGPRYEAEVRLPQGKYYYKFIVGGKWRHSTLLPVEIDERGNVNNVIRVGDIASIRSLIPTYQQVKDPTVVKVIERQLTEDERFMLAFAARRVAFSICPKKLVPKKPFESWLDS